MAGRANSLLLPPPPLLLLPSSLRPSGRAACRPLHEVLIAPLGLVVVVVHATTQRPTAVDGPPCHWFPAHRSEVAREVAQASSLCKMPHLGPSSKTAEADALVVC